MSLRRCIRHGSLALVALSAGALPAAASNPPGLARPIVPGASAEVRVHQRSDGRLHAEHIEILDAGAPEKLLGPIQWIDAAESQFKLLGLLVQVRPDTRWSWKFEEPIGFADLSAGTPVKVEGKLAADGTFRARKIRVVAKTLRRGRLTGRIESVEPLERGNVVLRLLGQQVIVTQRTDLSVGNAARRPAISRRIGVIDEDDLLFSERNRFGDHFALASEIRLRSEETMNTDLDSTTDDGERIPGIFGIAGFMLDFKRVLLYAEAIGEREGLVSHGQDVDPPEEESDVRVGEAYVVLTGVPGPGLSLAIGRQKYNESREWYYNTKALDAVRLFGTYYPVTFQLSLSRNVFDDSRNVPDQEKTNLIAEVLWDLNRDWRLGGFWIRRDDRSALEDSPRILGLRLEGDMGRHLNLWADLARETGRRGRQDAATGAVVVDDVSARAFDAGLTLRPRIGGDPTFTLSHAWASGDPVPGDGEDGTFRQSGLHRNRDRYNGVVSFAYYGEALDPELSNLRIWTGAIGFRPSRPVSVDLVYHHYRQDVAASRLVGVELDEDPSGVDPHLGEEWDVIVGYEPRRAMELRVIAGHFEPGPAFPESADAAQVLNLQLKFRF